MNVSYMKPFGVELTDVDVRILPAAELDQLRTLISNDGIVVVRQQPLEEDEHVQLFRDLYPGETLGFEATGKTVAYVSNVQPDGVFGDGAATFHSDFSFTTKPNQINSLYGVEVEPGASATEFASGILGLAAIPERLRLRLEGLNIVHATNYEYAGHMPSYNLPGHDDLSGLTHKDITRARWPAIMKHPRTGNPQLFLTEAHAHHFSGLPIAESREIIAEVLEHLYAPENIYTHNWASGDLVLWDNLVLSHGRRATPATLARRTLRRVCIGEAEYLHLWDWSEAGVV